jgi:hypothetical protein
VIPIIKKKPTEAGPELLVLAKWEEFTSWFLARTARWPKTVRFTLTQRLENNCLDIAEQLVIARYDSRQRFKLLKDINLCLERLRLLLRISKSRQVMANKSFESAMRQIDEVGRMIYGWRQSFYSSKDNS